MKDLYTRVLLITALITSLLLGTNEVLYAQDGVLIDYAGNTRDNSAVLDVRSSTQGFLAPRVNIPNLAAASPVTSPANGLLVYNTNGTTGEGYYYWNGSSWVRLMSGNTTPITGAGAANKVAFWTSATDLSQNTNFHWDNSNIRLGIGTPSPGVALDVTGRISATSHISSSSGNLHTNRGRLAFSNTATDANHTIYNNYADLDGEGAWDGMKMNVFNGLNIRVGNQGVTSALYIDNQADVGIGTTNPLEELEIYRNGSNPVQLFHSGGVASYKLGNDGNVFKIAAMDNGYGGSGGDFAANDVQVLSMQTDGDIGIGTVAPASKLHVMGKTNIHQSGAGGGQNRFEGLESPTSANGRAQLVLSSSYSDIVIASSQANNSHGSTLTFATYNPSNASDYRKFVVNQGNWGTRSGFLDFGYGTGVSNPHTAIGATTTTMSLDGSNKRVGIGTLTPATSLQVTNYGGTNYNGTTLLTGADRPGMMLTGTYPHLVIGSSVNNPNHAGTLSFWHNNNGGTTTSMWNMGASDVGFTIGYGTNNSNPHLGLEDYTTPSVMSLETNGNVGIGIITPSERLHVVGNARITALGAGGTRMVTTDNNGVLGAQALPGGVLPAGSTNQTLYHNGSGWTAGSNLSNTGSTINLGQFTTPDIDEWAYVTWLRNTGLSWDEGLIKGSSARGAWGRAGFGIHMHSSRHFGFFSTNWDNLWDIEGGTGRMYVKGNTGIGDTSPDARLNVQTSDNTSDWPSTSSLGDIDLYLERNNQGVEFGQGGAGNERKSWILARHNGLPTYGQYYQSMHLQPALNNLSQYRGIGIGYAASTTIPVNTYLAVAGDVGIGTLNPGSKLHVTTTVPDGIWDYSALSNLVSLELGENGDGNVGSIKLNSYDANQFVFLRPSNGNYHIDATTGQYYFNWDEDVRGASNGAIHMANQAGTHTVELNSAGNSWLSGGNLGLGLTGPTERLHVSGNARVSGLAGTGSRPVYADANGVLETNGAITRIDPLYVRGTGLNRNSNRVFKLGSTQEYSGGGRGLTLSIIRKSDHAVLSNTNYDCYGSTAAADQLATALNGVDNGEIGVLTSYDAWEGSVTANLEAAFKRLGLYKALMTPGGSRRPYAAVFEGSSSSTVPSVSAVEVEHSSNSNQPYAEIRGWLIDGSFVASTQVPSGLSTPIGDMVVGVDENYNVQITGNNSNLSYSNSHETNDEWRLVYSDDFESGNEGWVANTRTSSGDNGITREDNGYVGYSYWIRPTNGNNRHLKKYFDMTGITYSEVKVEMSYYFLDSWDNENAWVAIGNVEAYSGSSAPSQIWNARWQHDWGDPAPSTNRSFWGNSSWSDGVQYVTGISPNNYGGTGFWLHVGSSLDSGTGDETFAIDNVRIYVR